MQPQPPLVSVIIPAYNESKYIETALRSITNSRYPKDKLEILVIDNNSTDNTREIVESLRVKVKLLKNGNVGAVRNYGVSQSKGSYIVFLDADCVVDPDWLQRGIEKIQSNSDIVCGGPYRSHKDANWVEKLWLLENPKMPRLQSDLLGGCIFISRANFSAVQGFNEGITSGEDTEISQDLRQSGKSVEIHSDLGVIHLGTPDKLSAFIKRQIWHSENYLQSRKNLHKDPTFLLVLCFSISFIAFSVFSIASQPIYAGFSVALMFLASVVQSIKRVYSCQYTPGSLSEVLGILALDWFYLTGRSLGLAKSLKKTFRNWVNPKPT